MATKSSEIDTFEYYPQYCFSLSKTYSTWARLSASDIHLRLHQPSSFPCAADTWFILNHPIRAIRVVGTVIAADVYENRTAVVIDDYSGHTLELYANHDECDLSKVQVDDVIKARGTVSEFRQRKQMTVKKVEVVEDEIHAWKEMVEWKMEFLLPGPWRLTEKQVAKKRREYKKAKRREREEKEAEELRKRKERIGNEGGVVILQDERKMRNNEIQSATAEVDAVRRGKLKLEKVKREKIGVAEMEVVIVRDDPMRARTKRARSRESERNPQKKLRTETELPSGDPAPALQPKNGSRPSAGSQIPPTSSIASTMDWEVEIVDDTSMSHHQPPKERRLLPIQPPFRPVARSATNLPVVPAPENWDVEIVEDRRATSNCLRASPYAPKPPKAPSVKSQVLSYLRATDPPNITMRELTDAGIPVDFRVMEEIRGEGWLLNVGGNTRGRDVVWTYVGECLIWPELQSALRRSRKIDAREIWCKLKKNDGFEKVGKEAVKEVIMRIMENNTDWRGDGRGTWRRIDQYG